MYGYQLKITIKGSKPPIWRRVIIPGRITFEDLDNIIERLFGWTHSHLFSFQVNEAWETFDGPSDMESESNADVCIDEWIGEGDKFTYTYDFGDNWEHSILVEKVLEYDKRCPVTVKSKGPNMIEDCGGIWGFYECMDDAEPFDMEAVNAEFETWNIPEAAVEDHVLSEEDMKWNGKSVEDMSEQEMLDAIMEMFDVREDQIRDFVQQPESLMEAFEQYSKEDLKTIARIHGFRGISKMAKDELAKWLREQLLDTDFMQKLFSSAGADELQLFDSAIEKNGIVLGEDLIENSLILSTYGCFNPDTDFYMVPLDVQEKYKEVATPELRQRQKIRETFVLYCDAAIFLYGVLPLTKFTEIFNRYENTQLTKEEIEAQIQRLIDEGEPFVIQDGMLFDDELAEENLYQLLWENQQGIPYYLPENRDEFLLFGQYEGDKPNENTQFFIDYLQKRQNVEGPYATLLFYEVQEILQLNGGEEELLDTMKEYGCQLTKQKKVKEALDNLRKLNWHVRKWDLRGHTATEMRSLPREEESDAPRKKIVQFVPKDQR